MSFQGQMRNSPPTCTGQGEPDTGEHCCWVNGEVCQFYRPNDPRDTRPGAVHSCGLVLDFQEQFPQQDINRIWQRVHRHPLYEQIVQAVWNQFGVTPCGDWLGAIQPDGTIEGQCCFRGYTFDADGNVLTEPGA